MRLPLQIATLQYDIRWENQASNLNTIDELLSQIEPETDLVILPETFSTGFTMNVRSMAETMDGETVSWMQNRAEVHQCDIIGSLIIEAEGQYYNRLIWMSPQGIREVYDKRHLFALAGEDRVFTPGKQIIEVELKGWTIRPLICYDLRFPVWSRTKGETDLIIYVANFPEKRRYAWRQLLIARAIENQCYVIGLNRIGWDGKQRSYSGDSMLVDPLGGVRYDLQNEPIVGQWILEDDILEDVRHRLPFHRDADEFEIT